ncbi:hypothetical protein F0P96_11580 [Hymenobacter busanensis]|uniref:Uncharacterized protein n=1 Tax=Hymenobacter busanensis TaxID=2607656 RepID=A0A7L4ZVP0_9BACT|nr:hypothetical protein [Hymenobacter busanensis]KAA9332122.1 hypothetical protein F0P96_11580 [Hymenobacter busanensis]QHJ07539.1 hypothetical protein GUY19_09690 [Hymenobacter busanensis]
MAASPAHAQRVTSAAAPPPTPAPVFNPAPYRATGSVGSYQTPDGHWHPVRVGTWQRDRVYLGDIDGQGVRPYFPAEVKAFVSIGDTVAAVQSFVLPKKHRLVAQGFARQLTRQGSYTLFQYDHTENPTLLSSLTSQVMLLRRGQEPLLVVPTKAKPYRALMLKLLGDCPAVVRQLQAGAVHPWRDTQALLATYASWQNQTASATRPITH